MLAADAVRWHPTGEPYVEVVYSNDIKERIPTKGLTVQRIMDTIGSKTQVSGTYICIYQFPRLGYNTIPHDDDIWPWRWDVLCSYLSHMMDLNITTSELNNSILCNGYSHTQEMEAHERLQAAGIGGVQLQSTFGGVGKVEGLETGRTSKIPQM